MPDGMSGAAGACGAAGAGVRASPLVLWSERSRGGAYPVRRVLVHIPETATAGGLSVRRPSPSSVARVRLACAPALSPRSPSRSRRPRRAGPAGAATCRRARRRRRPRSRCAAGSPSGARAGRSPPWCPAGIVSAMYQTSSSSKTVPSSPSSAPASAPTSAPSSPAAPKPIRAPARAPSLVSSCSSEISTLSIEPSSSLCTTSRSMTRTMSCSREPLELRRAPRP